jgi:hypothetical protein
MAKAEWAKTTALVNVAVSILKREYPMTIRQLFYRIVSRGVILNNLSCYKMVSRVMGKARKDACRALQFLAQLAKSQVRLRFQQRPHLRPVHTARAVPKLRSTLHHTTSLVRSRYLPRPRNAHSEPLRKLAQRTLTRRMSL